MKVNSAKRTLTGTHKSGPLNSTDFTNCCGLAVLHDDHACPGCDATVFRTREADTGKCRMCGKSRSHCYC